MVDVDWPFVAWNGICGICSLALVMSYCISSSFRTPTNAKVFLMCTCHLLLIFKYLLVRAAPGHIVDGSLTCNLAGAADAFLLQATLGWQGMLAVGLWSSLTNYRVSTLYQHLFVWTLSVASAVIGWMLDLFSPAYGDEDCWWALGLPRLFILIPLVAWMVFSIYLITYAQYRMRSIHVALAKRRQILKRMSLFVGVFICAFLPEAIHIAWTMFRVADIGVKHPDVESPLEEWAAYGIVGSGIGNLLVWSSTPAFRRSCCCCCRQCVPRTSSVKVPLTRDPSAGGNGKRVDGWQRATIAASHATGRATIASPRGGGTGANGKSDGRLSAVAGGEYEPPTATAVMGRISGTTVVNGRASHESSVSDQRVGADGILYEVMAPLPPAKSEILRRYTRHGDVIAGGGGGTGNWAYGENVRGDSTINVNPYGLPTGDTPSSSFHDRVSSVLAEAGDLSRRSSLSHSRGGGGGGGGSGYITPVSTSRTRPHQAYRSGDNSNETSISRLTTGDSESSSLTRPAK